MNICFIAEHKIDPSGGGIERVTYLLAKELYKRGNKIIFVATDGIKVSNGNCAEFQQFIFDLTEFEPQSLNKKFSEFIANEEIDMLVFQHNGIINERILNCLDNSIKKVITLHNQPFSILNKERDVKRKIPYRSLRAKGKLLKTLAIVMPSLFRKFYLQNQRKRYSHLLSKIDKMVLLSERYIPRLLTHMPIKESSKLIAINNPVTFSLKDNGYVKNEKKNIVLIVCRFSDHQKNLTGFIDVWKVFSKLHSEWQAVLVGDGEDMDIIKQYARRNKVNNIIFEGSKRNIEDYYRKSKIFCMTSFFEGWPMVLMEAMAFGCVPVVFDSFEAVHDIIDDGNNGIIVPAFKNKKMVEALSRLADDRDLLDRMATVGTDSIADFTVEKIVDEWEDKVLKAF